MIPRDVVLGFFRYHEIPLYDKAIVQKGHFYPQFPTWAEYLNDFYGMEFEVSLGQIPKDNYLKIELKGRRDLTPVLIFIGQAGKFKTQQAFLLGVEFLDEALDNPALGLTDANDMIREIAKTLIKRKKDATDQ